jgi:hypothetical protein
MPCPVVLTKNLFLWECIVQRSAAATLCLGGVRRQKRALTHEARLARPRVPGQGASSAYRVFVAVNLNAAPETINSLVD